MTHLEYTQRIVVDDDYRSYRFEFRHSDGFTQTPTPPPADVMCNGRPFGRVSYHEIEDVDGYVGGRWEIRLPNGDLMAQPNLTRLLTASVNHLNRRGARF